MAARAVLGTIVKTVGLKGEVKLLPAPDFWPEALDAGGIRIVADGEDSGAARVLRRRWKGQTVILVLEGVDTIEKSEPLVGSSLVLALDDVEPGAGPGGTLPCQLIGLEVRLPDGSVLGVVADMLLGPAQNCLIVERAGERFLVPDTPGIVKRVAMEEGFIDIDPPEGLVDLRW
jgi:16S rRNA processing protein RimM